MSMCELLYIQPQANQNYMPERLEICVSHRLGRRQRGWLLFCAHNTRLSGLLEHPTYRQVTYNLQAVIKWTHENHQEIRAGKEPVGGSGVRECHLRPLQGIWEGKPLPQGTSWDSILDHLSEATIALSACHLPQRQLSQGSRALCRDKALIMGEMGLASRDVLFQHVEPQKPERD